MLPRMQRVWRNEPSHSQANPHVGNWSPKWSLESLERNYRRQNLLPWKVLYIIEKLLKLRCQKWVRITNLETWNTSYGQKKCWESNWYFDSQALKVRNQPNCLVCRQHTTYCWKVIDHGYNFAWDLITIEGLHAKLCTSKVMGVPGWKAIWMWPPWRGT
jgi:hypothetical protein